MNSSIITSINNIMNQTDSSRTAGTYHIANVDSNGSPINGFTTNGNGIEASFTVNVDSNGKADITVTSGGSEDNAPQYHIGDTITIENSKLGGSVNGDLSFKVASVSAVTYPSI